VTGGGARSGAAGPRPKRSLGQNFLIDPNPQRAIVGSLDPCARDTVVEVGPGRGALTGHLAGAVGRVVCVELDDGLAAELRGRYAADPGVEILHADFLETERGAVGLAEGAFKLVGNLPYNRASAMLFHVLSAAWRPAAAVVMVQREVADRILAAPGGRTYGALSVGIRTRADVELVMQVSRRAFRPVPDVESSVLRVRPHLPPRLAPGEEAAVRTLTRVAFGRRRKQFQRILRDAPEFHLSRAAVESLARDLDMDLRARPETFGPEAFVILARALANR
jgi:16S rRNA (adenine1518-N6/adenine1519-N6)-dimethyltransferase